MGRTGSQTVIDALHAEKVEVLFGFPGGVVIPVFDALYGEKAIRLVLTRHEQGAVHAADGYARSTGRPGVCLVTSGPGATNTVTGLATANFDSIPLVVITGKVSRKMIGNDAFQEADIVGISRSVTKHNYLVTERKDLGRIMREAFYIATSGRPGPVLVDIPKDVLLESSEEPLPETVSIRGYNPVYKGHPMQIRKAVRILGKAKKPLFYVGGGMNISGAAEAFRKVVEKVNVPTIASLMGISVLPSEHPRFLGMLGMHGTYAANMAVQNCDLLFAIGTRFDDRATGEIAKFAPNATVVHIDIDPASISRNVAVSVPIVGDARLVLEEMLPQLEAPSIDEWVSLTDEWKKTHPVTEIPDNDRLSPTAVIRAIAEAFPEAIVTTEVGQNQMWTALYYNFREPRTFLTSGGLGTMGYGFPAAIGAQLGNPGRRVIDIAGDGSIQMNIQELATAVAERLPVIVAILNNGYLGMVRQWQELFYNRRYSATCLERDARCPPECASPGAQCPPYSPDFVKLAEAYGAVGIRVATPAEIGPALARAREVTDRPVFIDFLIQREANVWPMVPAGAGNDEMMNA
ncbi:MAG: biosynthetic-type acetolactate synthase large subunit [Spirochaetes bacterium]|nr:biosynthetic-type acetolactate synthase large subunit [Spirochaetota bacterium]